MKQINQDTQSISKLEKALAQFVEKSPKFTGEEVLAEDIKQLEQKVDLIDSELRSEIAQVQERIGPKGEDGKDGSTPTKEELVSLIVPLIPKTKDGKTPTSQELLTLIKPLIPNTDDSIREAEERIKKSIPTIEEIENTIPSLKESIRDGLELLKEDERLDKSAIKGIEDLEEKINKIEKTPTVGGGGTRGVQLYIQNIKKGLVNTINILGGTGVTIGHSHNGGQNDITINASGSWDKPFGTAVFTYDVDGNVSTKTVGSTVLTFDYDVNGNVSTVTDGTHTKTFSYDGDGNVDNIVYS